MLAWIGAIIVFVLALIFKQKKSQEKSINRSKVPENVLQWEPEIYQASKEFNVPPTIALSVLWVESNGRKNARGSAGEKGLMQLKEIAVNDLKIKGYGTFPNWQTDPKQNIRAGVAYLALQFKRTGNWYEAVKAYNQGFKGKDLNPVKAANYLKEVRNKEKFFN